MSAPRKATTKFLSFAAQIAAGLDPVSALRASDYNTDNCKVVTLENWSRRLLQHPALSVVLADAHALAINGPDDDLIMDRKEAMKQWTLQARGTIGDIADFKRARIRGEDGVIHEQIILTFKNSDELTEDQLAIIESMEATPTSFKIKLRSADVARKELARLQGWQAPPKVPVGQDGADAPPVIQNIVRTVVDPGAPE